MKAMITVLTVATLALSSEGGEIFVYGNPAHGLGIIPDLPEGECYIAIGSGPVANHILAARSDGEVVAWGQNDYGQCDVPAECFGATAVGALQYGSIALLTDGSIERWGSASSSTPSYPSPFVALAAGGAHFIGLRENGVVQAVGWNEYGQSEEPYPMEGYIAVGAGRNHTLAVKASDGMVIAWGQNQYGQCDVPDSGVGPYTAVAGGEYHSIALRSNGSVRAWGRNNYGQCTVPSPNSGFVAVAAGGDFSMALRANGTVVAWGENSDGQCNINGLTGVVAIAAGWNHSVALTEFYLSANPSPEGSFEECRLSLSQNPFAGVLNVTAPGAESIRIYDISGRIVGEIINSDTFNWNSSDCPNGMYLFVATLEDGKVVAARAVRAE
jgi:hypothetical protein